MTAPQLSKELEVSLEGVHERVLDLSMLVYISSIGLRVVLQAQRKLKGKGTMIVKNPSSLVAEILDLTRFNEILTIE